MISLIELAHPSMLSLVRSLRKQGRLHKENYKHNKAHSRVFVIVCIIILLLFISSLSRTEPLLVLRLVKVHHFIVTFAFAISFVYLYRLGIARHTKHTILYSSGLTIQGFATKTKITRLLAFPRILEVSYEFKINGKSYKGSMDISEKDLSPLTEITEGDAVIILYDERNPSRNAILIPDFQTVYNLKEEI